MNVLFITELYPKDKNESVKTISFAVKELVEGLSDFDITVTKVVIPVPYIRWRELKYNKEIISILNNIEVETKTFCNIPKYGLRLCFKNVEYFQKVLMDVDLVIAHMFNGAYIANELYKKFKVPYIYILHNSDLRNLEKQKELFDNAKSIYARSWALQNKLEKHNVHVNGVVYSGIDKKLIIDKKIKNSKLKFISVNRLQKLKNIDVVLHSLSKLSAKLEWEYTIIGDGEEYKNISELIEDLNLNDKVKMLGFKERNVCIQYMRESDVFIMPSAPETFGLAYLEAMASGCIVICAKGWGIDGLIQNGISGYTVEARNIEELSKILEKILTEEQSILYINSLQMIKQYTLYHAQKNYAQLIKSNFLEKYNIQNILKIGISK